MNYRTLATALMTAALALPFTVQAEEEKEGFLPDVDEPIADTYEPLDGAGWNHRLSPELQTLREYQRQQREKERQEALRAEERRRLESKIQAPDPGQLQPTPEPEIKESGDSLRISDPE